MIELADKVSENIEKINRRYKQNVIIFVVGAFLGYFLAVAAIIWTSSPSLNDKSEFYAIFFIFNIAAIGYYISTNYLKKEEEIKIESEVLGKLLNTIFPYKTSIFRGAHNMKMKEAIIDMRLSRLKFTYKVDVDVNEKIKDNEIIPIENIPIPQPKEPATTP